MTYRLGARHDMIESHKAKYELVHVKQQELTRSVLYMSATSSRCQETLFNSPQMRCYVWLTPQQIFFINERWFKIFGKNGGKFLFFYQELLTELIGLIICKEKRRKVTSSLAFWRKSCQFSCATYFGFSILEKFS